MSLTTSSELFDRCAGRHAAKGVAAVVDGADGCLQRRRLHRQDWWLISVCSNGASYIVYSRRCQFVHKSWEQITATTTYNSMDILIQDYYNLKKKSRDNAAKLNDQGTMHECWHALRTCSHSPTIRVDAHHMCVQFSTIYIDEKKTTLATYSLRSKLYVVPKNLDA